MKLETAIKRKRKEKRVFNNSNNDFEKSVVVWEWDGWTKRRKESKGGATLWPRWSQDHPDLEKKKFMHNNLKFIFIYL